MRNALAAYISSMKNVGEGAGFAPPQGPEGPNMPWMDVQDRRAPNPAISAGFNLPAGGGDLTMRGNLFKPDAQSPVDWGAMLGYHRQF
jgi:hypothetical protein